MRSFKCVGLCDGIQEACAAWRTEPLAAGAAGKVAAKRADIDADLADGLAGI